MIYLSEFYFPSQNSEANYLAKSPRAKMTCYDSFYPFGLFAGRGLKALDLADVTILYGGNGSGKTTALNVMADALRLQRGAQYNRSDFFPDYVSLCQFHTLHAIPAGSLILTSDDVFDYMLDVRAINDNIDTRRGSLFDEYTEARTAKFQMHSMEDYDRLKQVSAARRYSKSQVARKTLSPNIRTHSNGESAFLMFQEKLRGDALYLLDALRAGAYLFGTRSPDALYAGRRLPAFRPVRAARHVGRHVGGEQRFSGVVPRRQRCGVRRGERRRRKVALRLPHASLRPQGVACLRYECRGRILP